MNLTALAVGSSPCCLTTREQSESKFHVDHVKAPPGLGPFSKGFLAQRFHLLMKCGMPRDFKHVSDIVRGIELVAEHALIGIYDPGTGQRDGFETGVEMSNEELATAVEPENTENQIPDSVYLHDICAGPSKKYEATSWEPEINFEGGFLRVCPSYCLDD